MKKISLILICIISVIILIGCEPVGVNEELYEYKESSKLELEQSFLTKEKYSDKDWKIVFSYVNKAKEKIDLSQSIDEIDIIIKETKESINKIKTIEETINNKDNNPNNQEMTINLEGNGTVDDPYIISNETTFIEFSYYINNGIGNELFYELDSDIDLSGFEWMPIGCSASNPFNGHFNGNGYEIRNCKITQREINTDMENIGVFGYNSGVIENVGIINLCIDIEWQYYVGYCLSVYAGGIAGTNEGKINNSYTIGSIDLAYYGMNKCTLPADIEVGTFTAVNNGKIYNSYSQIDINVMYLNDFGMVSVAGMAVGGKIENCFTIYTENIEYLGFNIDGTYSNTKTYEIGAADEINCYSYNSNVKSYTCSADELNILEFYIDKLGWDRSIWNLDNIKFINDKYLESYYPKLVIK